MSKIKSGFPANSKTRFFSGGKVVEKRVAEEKSESKDAVLSYKIVTEIGLDDFEREVNYWLHLDRGYKPQGGVAINSISANLKGWVFTQALIKK